MLINLSTQCSSVPKWTITLLPVSLLCLRVPLASSSSDPKFWVRMCRRGAHQPSASVSQIPSPRMARLNDSLCICLSLLLPCTSCPLPHPVLRLNSQRASVKGHDPPRPLLIFENFICTNICQGSYLHPSLNPHGSLAFLLIWPNKAQ